MADLRVVVVDDELLARKRMVRLLEAVGGVELVAALEDGGPLAPLLDEEAVDLVLMDIDMPGVDGLRAAAALGPDGPSVVFVTAHPEHALRAFELAATDYLLKPIDEARLSGALDRVRRSRPSAPPPVDGLLALPTRRGVRLVKAPEVAAAVLVGASLEVWLVGGERLFVDLPLSALEERLTDPPFVRAHRRALLNLERVHTLEDAEGGGYLAHMSGVPPVVVSRRVARALRRRLGLRG